MIAHILTSIMGSALIGREILDSTFDSKLDLTDSTIRLEPSLPDEMFIDSNSSTKEAVLTSRTDIVFEVVTALTSFLSPRAS